MIDLENGGAKVMRKDSMMISGLNEEGYTFPSPMTLRFQAIRSACQFQRKFWIVSLAGLLLIIAGIVSAFVIIASKNSSPTPTPSPEPAKNYSKKYSYCSVYV